MTLKKISATAFAVLLTGMLVVTTVMPVFAADHPVLDTSKKGSITMTHLATDTDEPIEGSKMVAFKVADADFNEGRYEEFEYGDAIYIPVDGLDTDSIRAAMNGVSESDAGAYDLAAKLESMVNSAGISGVSKVTDADGIATWTDLDVGLYLIVNVAPADGYEAIPSFLISVPRFLDGEYVYDVETFPKPAPATEIPEEDEEVPPDKLVQTGQLWWPVPLLAGCGLLLIGIGAYRRKHA